MSRIEVTNSYSVHRLRL